MLWAQAYAAANREQMMDELLRSLAELLELAPAEVEADRINCHHNYTALEHHHGRDLWITRKGAIKAGVDDRGRDPRLDGHVARTSCAARQPGVVRLVLARRGPAHVAEPGAQDVDGRRRSTLRWGQVWNADRADAI